MLAIGNLLSALWDHTVLPSTWTRYDAAALGNGSFLLREGVVDFVDVPFFLDEEAFALEDVLFFLVEELAEKAEYGCTDKKIMIRIGTINLILTRHSSLVHLLTEKFRLAALLKGAFMTLYASCGLSSRGNNA